MSPIHLARFGNKNNAHSVVAHSGVEQRLLSSLLYRSDAPPDSAGLGLEPFVSCYPHEDFYIVQATRSDPKSERPGMVVTDAAILPLPEVAVLDLAALWTALTDGALSIVRPLDTEILLGTSKPAETHVHTAGAGALASVLLRDGRAVWTGQGLQDCMACLWLHLPNEDRIRLVISAAAHPGRIPVPTPPGSLSIIATTFNTVNRWHEWSRCSADSVADPDSARDAMFGDDGGRSHALAKKLELTPFTMNGWRLLARTADLLGRLEDLHHEQCRGLIQLLGVLQPDPTLGADVKAQALRHLHILTPGVAFADIRGLRRLPWHSVSVLGPQPLLDEWIPTVLSEPIKIGDLIDCITTAREVKQDQFTDALNAALTVGIQQTDLSRLAIAAVGNPGGEELLEWLITSGISTDKVDSAVATAIQVTKSRLEWLPASSRAFSLPRTHALSVDVSDSVAAWNEQIMLNPRSTAAEDALALRTGPDGVIAAALSITDRDLTTRAATAVLSDTTLLEGHSVSEARFRDIWFSAVQLGVDPWAVVEPTMAVTPLLDLLVAGKPVESEILMSLSRTTAADICQYSARSQLWDLLPSNASAGFKSATAGTFARTYSPGDSVPERQLQDAILSAPLLESVSRESSAQAIALLRGMPSSHAQHAVLVATHGRFNPHEEYAIASLVVERRWQSAVEPIIRLSSTRPDLLSAARRVSNLLGFWDRLLLNVTAGYSPTHTISTSDLNSGLQEIAAELYPTGPKEGGIWARAGGHEADLPVAHTGRLAWGQALQGTQEGRRGSATPSGLVDGMLEDFPHNLKLQNLKALLTKGFEYDRSRR